MKKTLFLLLIPSLLILNCGDDDEASNGRPDFKVSDDNVDNVGTVGKGNFQILTNLFKRAGVPFERIESL